MPMARIYTLTTALLIVILGMSSASCGHDSEPMDTSLIKGKWELATDNASAMRHIYLFTTPSEQTQSWGVLTTYTADASGKQTVDKVYDWHISDPSNDNPVLLDITLKGETTDTGDIWDGHHRYIVERLTTSEMTLRLYEVGDSKTRLHFTRLTK